MFLLCGDISTCMLHHFLYIMYYIIYIFSFTRNTFRTKNKHSKIIYDKMHLRVVWLSLPFRVVIIDDVAIVVNDFVVVVNYFVVVVDYFVVAADDCVVVVIVEA